MDTKTSSTRTEGLVALFDMQTDFLSRAIEGISNEDMYNRLNTKANHMAWLVGSLVHQRFLMTTETHPGEIQKGEELFKNNKGIQDEAKYPSNQDYLADWQMITPKAREALTSMDDAKLDSDFDMGGMTMSYFDLLIFTVYREASIFGQLALWRRLLGYPAMRYD
jgi:hypothetical protein